MNATDTIFAKISDLRQRSVDATPEEVIALTAALKRAVEQLQYHRGDCVHPTADMALAEIAEILKGET